MRVLGRFLRLRGGGIFSHRLHGFTRIFVFGIFTYQYPVACCEVNDGIFIG